MLYHNKMNDPKLLSLTSMFLLQQNIFSVCRQKKKKHVFLWRDAISPIVSQEPNIFVPNNFSQNGD